MPLNPSPDEHDDTRPSSDAPGWRPLPWDRADPPVRCDGCGHHSGEWADAGNGVRRALRDFRTDGRRTLCEDCRRAHARPA